MEEENKDFLPAGTIVKLRLEDELYMIIGHLPAKRLNERFARVKKYCAVNFPFGYDGIDNISSFNEDFIKKVIYKGYEDEEYKEYNEKLINLYSRVRHKKGE